LPHGRPLLLPPLHVPRHEPLDPPAARSPILVNCVGVGVGVSVGVIVAECVGLMVGVIVGVAVCNTHKAPPIQAAP
jgi:hypothetical protein